MGEGLAKLTGRTASLEAPVLGFRHLRKRLSSPVPMYIQGNESKKAPKAAWVGEGGGE